MCESAGWNELMIRHFVFAHRSKSNHAKQKTQKTTHIQHKKKMNMNKINNKKKEEKNTAQMEQKLFIPTIVRHEMLCVLILRLPFFYFILVP